MPKGTRRDKKVKLEVQLRIGEKSRWAGGRGTWGATGVKQDTHLDGVQQQCQTPSPRPAILQQQSFIFALVVSFWLVLCLRWRSFIIYTLFSTAVLLRFQDFNASTSSSDHQTMHD
jgi:hypothetical protein